MKKFREEDLAGKDEFYQRQLRPHFQGGIHSKPRAHKWGAKPGESIMFTILTGRRFDSQLERRRAEQLCILQTAKEIKALEFQPRVFLSRADISYKPDFKYKERFDGKWRWIWEEVKGARTERWGIIKNLWRYYGPGLLRITVDVGKGIIRVREEIIPKKKGKATR